MRPAAWACTLWRLPPGPTSAIAGDTAQLLVTHIAIDRMLRRAYAAAGRPMPRRLEDADVLRLSTESVVQARPTAGAWDS